MKKIWSFILKYKIIFIIVASAIGVSAAGLFLVINNTNNCTVQYDANGGSYVVEQKIHCGNTVREPDIPIKKGFKFLGWFYNDELFDFNFVINENMTLIAHWEKEKDIITS